MAPGRSEGRIIRTVFQKRERRKRDIAEIRRIGKSGGGRGREEREPLMIATVAKKKREIRWSVHPCIDEVSTDLDLLHSPSPFPPYFFPPSNACC